MKTRIGLVIFSLALSIFPVLAKDAKASLKPRKTEIVHSMMGFRNTLVMYEFKDQKTILQVNIDNKDDSFPLKGKLYIFDPSVTEDGMKKWINNQHSDARYPDVPQPKITKNLPEGFAKVTSKTPEGAQNNPGPAGGTYMKYEVSLSVKAVVINSNNSLPTFTDTVKAYVRKRK